MSGAKERGVSGAREGGLVVSAARVREGCEWVRRERERCESGERERVVSGAEERERGGASGAGKRERGV